MLSVYQIEDKELGLLKCKVNPRARRFIFRSSDGGIEITVPSGVSQDELRGALEKVRPRLRLLKEKHAYRLIDLSYTLCSDCFNLSLVEGRGSRFFVSSDSGKLIIVCPIGTDFRNLDLQKWLRKVVLEALRRRAKDVLPLRLEALSKHFGLPYRGVKINSSRGRWGSCSATKSINLSCYLLLLPSRLIDYVLLHELAHTREMNHGGNFWALLNRLTDGKAPLLRRELKGYKTGI